jgi:hypothetical protein
MDIRTYALINLLDVDALDNIADHDYQLVRLWYWSRQ